MNEVMRIVVITHLTLDGVMQAPAAADEDPRDGFTHGGWEPPYGDEVMMQNMGFGGTAPASADGDHGGGLLFGRRTYEQFHSVWPKRTDSPFSDILNRAQKYVASRSLKEPLPWENSTLLPGDAAESVGRLKAGSGARLLILGSGELVRSLMHAHLIDEYVLLIHPLVLGSGRRLFADGSAYTKLELTKTTITTKGVVIANYRNSR